MANSIKVLKERTKVQVQVITNMVVFFTDFYKWS